MFIQPLLVLVTITVGSVAIPQGWKGHSFGGNPASTSVTTAVLPQLTSSAGASATQPASASPPAPSTTPGTSSAQSSAASPPPATSVAAGAGGGGETHQITVINNCGGGTPMLAYSGNRAGQAIQGVTTISGPITSGISWMSGLASANCGFDGTNCGFMEFTIGNGGQNSADYSLLTTGLGDHYFKYAMDFRFTGECALGPGKCTSGSNCPNAYSGTDTFSGDPTTCPGQNVGITLTFC
ncbi:uncharacterized protein IL334_002971 [Kwoniella shivajii]|uniref:Uncharacterized protein n=1 Tax=Kwoniella shivajii TaxID=564305 RepID=A0ABZ1CXX6_9TREE|nr:hypothetical protein IL334_002971 [Kwoniella shivajii]